MATLKQITKSREKRESIHKAIQHGLKSGDDHFHHLYDRSISIIASLENAGFTITQKRKHNS